MTYQARPAGVSSSSSVAGAASPSARAVCPGFAASARAAALVFLGKRSLLAQEGMFDDPAEEHVDATEEEPDGHGDDDDNEGQVDGVLTGGPGDLPQLTDDVLYEAWADDAQEPPPLALRLGGRARQTRRGCRSAAPPGLLCDHRVSPQGPAHDIPLPGLAVQPVAAAAGTVLLQLQAVRVVPPVLGGGIVPLPALRAGQVDDDAVLFLSHGWRALSRPLLQDLGGNARSYGVAALADGESQALLQGDGLDELDRHLHVVARHYHLHPLGQLGGAGDVGGADVELGAVAVEEWRVPAA